MSFLPSLVLYNPLEALVIILICDLFTKRKFKLIDIVHCYVLGAINLMIQYISVFINDSALQLIYNIFVSLILTSIITYLYYNLAIKERINLIYAFYALGLQYISVSIAVYILNSIIPNAYTNVISVKYELITNLCLRIAQIIIIFTIYLIRRNKNVKT